MEGEGREVEPAGEMKKEGKRGERMSGVGEFFIINCGPHLFNNKIIFKNDFF